MEGEIFAIDMPALILRIERKLFSPSSRIASQDKLENEKGKIMTMKMVLVQEMEISLMMAMMMVEMVGGSVYGGRPPQVEPEEGAGQ